MKGTKSFFMFAACATCFFLFASPVFSAQKFVVISDIVFAREYPTAVSPLENMTIKELSEAYWRQTHAFPQYYYYGQNIVGEVDQANPTVVRTTVKIYRSNHEEKIIAYVDLKKLWPEPLLSDPPVDRHMTKQNADVYLLPDFTSRKVLSLYQGEVVEVVGNLHAGGVSWAKARFCDDTSYYDIYTPRYEDQKGPYEEHCSRYGYIRTDVLLALLPGNVNEASLTAVEIPVTMRNSNLALSEADRTRLAKDGFFIEEILPNSNVYVDDMVDRYHPLNSSKFITSDLYLHVFHLIFDRMLQSIEEQKIYPEIAALTKKMVSESEKELKSYTGNDRQIQKAIVHNLFFFSVAAKLLDPSFRAPANVQPDVQAFVQKIVNAEGLLPSLESKIELGEEDFSQYRPRGHYISKKLPDSQKEEDVDAGLYDSDLLERYFRVMMWYGRHAFLLSDDTKTISAVLISKALESSGEITRWKRINAALTRLVGKMDDWSPEDYSKVSVQIFGTNTPSANNISKNAQIKSFKQLSMKILPKQRIVSTQTGVGRTQEERLNMTAGFKFFGQRFTPDAYVFNQLTSPSVGTDSDPRNLPTSLDVMALLGSKAAATILEEEMKSHVWAETYHSQTGKIRREFSEDIAKRETSYGGWLHTLEALLHPTGGKQVFAAGAPWQFKVLNTAVSSWTELKHDTILYSEQSYAESGSGDEFAVPSYQPPYVKGYIEPNFLFFSRLYEVVMALRTDLQQNNLLTDEYNDKLQAFARHVQKAGEIAKKEMDGDRITRDDYRWVELMSNSFDRSLLLPRDAGDIVDPETLKMALIADVATDAVGGRVLEAAVGAPQRIIVAVKDLYGGTRICTGYVYSWYEFADSRRWTDAEWKSLVYGGDQERIATMRPSWYSNFLGGSGSQGSSSQDNATGLSDKPAYHLLILLCLVSIIAALVWVIFKKYVLK